MKSVRFLSKVLLLIVVFGATGYQCLYSQPDQSQLVSGTVVDKDTGESLPGVNVYLSETTVGTVTDRDGKFELLTELTGGFKLVVSYVGYHSKEEEIYLERGKEPIELEFKLNQSSAELEELEVQASNSEWQNYFNQFREYFLGNSRYANETIIENGWSLDFEIDDENNLIAKAPEPLVVTNYALGYEIEIDLVEFKWNRNRNSGLYVIYTRFKEIDAKNVDQKKKWQKNRKNVYLGSFEHFLKSLYNDNLTSNRFEVVLKDSKNRIQIPKVVNVGSGGMNINTNIPGMDNETAKTYRLQGATDILYGRNTGYSNIDNRIRSRLIPMNRSGTFVVTKQGRLSNPSSLRIDGAWAEDRVAELLPVTYSLEE